MVQTIDIKEHMQIIGADGVPVAIVDKVEGQRIKLTRDDGHGGKRDHHHFLPINLVADIEGDKVRLSTTAANAQTFLEEEGGKPVMGEKTGDAKTSAFAFGGTGASASGQTSGSSSQGMSSQPTSSQSGQKIAPPMSASEKADAKAPSKTKGIAAALGVAAVGAAAFGASKLIKGRSDNDSIPLDNDENMRLISSAKVEGTTVLDRDGTSVGTIQNVMIDKYTGRVAYAILSFGGTFGFGATLFPLPWAALRYDERNDGYRLNVTKEQLTDAPKFEARDTPEFDAPYRRRIVLFYRAM